MGPEKRLPSPGELKRGKVGAAIPTEPTTILVSQAKHAVCHS